MKELKISTLNACWKKILPGSVEIEHVFESIANQMASILELAISIGEVGFADKAIEDVQDLSVEEDVGEADLVEMASEVNHTDSDNNSTDKDCD